MYCIGDHDPQMVFKFHEYIISGAPYHAVPPSIRFCPYFYGIRLSDTGVWNVSWEYGN